MDLWDDLRTKYIDNAPEHIRFCKTIDIVLNGVWKPARTELAIKAGDTMEWKNNSGFWGKLTVTPAMLQQNSAFMQYFARFSIFDDVREKAEREGPVLKVDGMELVVGERLVLNFGEDTKQNGVYTVASERDDGWQLKRMVTEDTDSWYDIWEPKKAINHTFDISMTLDRKAFDEMKKRIEDNYGQPEQLYLSNDMVDAIARAYAVEQNRYNESIQQLVKALEDGNYDTIYPIKGTALHIEDISAVMQNVTYDDSHIKLHKATSGDPPPGGWPDFINTPGVGNAPQTWEDITKVDFDIVDVDKFSEHQKPYNHPTYGNDQVAYPSADSLNKDDHRHYNPSDYPKVEQENKKPEACYMCAKATTWVYSRSLFDKFPCCVKCANDMNEDLSRDGS